MTLDSRDVAARYDAVATGYHHHWAPTLLPPAQELLRPLPLGDATVVVDVAAGTGILLPTLAELAPRATVLALDRSHGMLAQVSGAPRAQADCQAMPLRDGVADLVVFGFVLFHVPDKPRALREAHRVLRPGGRVATATWSMAETASPYDDALTDALDALGAPPPPALRDDTGVGSTEEVAELLTAAGFLDVDTATTRIHYAPTIDGYIGWRLEAGAMAERLRALPDDAQAEVLRRTRETLSALPDEQRVDRSVVVLGRGRRP